MECPEVSIVSLLRVSKKFFNCLTLFSLATLLNTAVFPPSIPLSLDLGALCFVFSLPLFHHHQLVSPCCLAYRLVGLVERRPPRERKIPRSNPACDGIFSGSSHTSDLKIGTPVAALPGAWRYRVSSGTGRPGVSILWLGEVESLTCNFYLSVSARKIVWADPSLRYTSMLLGRYTTNKQTSKLPGLGFLLPPW